MLRAMTKIGHQLLRKKRVLPAEIILATSMTAKCPPVCSQARSRVARDVTCSDGAGLRKRNPRWHSAALSTQATSVGDELCCSAGAFVVAVRPCRSTRPSTVQVEGRGVN